MAVCRSMLPNCSSAKLWISPVLARAELGEGLRAVAGERGVRADALLERGDQAERLERRPGLHRRAGGGVELDLGVVLAAVHRDDGAVARLDRGQARVQGGGARAGRHVVLDGLHGGVLRLLVDRGGDPQATAVELGVSQPELGAQLLLHVGGDVADRPALGLLGLGGDDLGELRLGALGGGEPALGLHPVEHVGHPGLRVLLLLRAERGVVEARATDDRRQQGTLAHRELGDVLVEVRLGRGLDAVGAAAVVDGVEVVGQDLGLGLLLVDLQRDDQLLALAGQGLVLGQEVVLDVLLGDRGATLGRPALDRGDEGATDAGGADALVLVEAAVLGGEQGVLHVHRHLRQRHRLTVAVHLGDPVHLGLAVAVVDDRGLRLGQLVRRGDADRHPGHRDRGHARQEQRQQGEQDALAREEATLPLRRGPFGRAGVLGVHGSSFPQGCSAMAQASSAAPATRPV